MKKMVKSSRNPRKRSSTFDENSKVSEAWTPLVIEEVKRLAADPDSGFKEQYLADELCKKFISVDTVSPDARRQAAISKWLSVEEKNVQTNARLVITLSEFNIFPGVRWDKWLNKFRSIIEDLLGPVPPYFELNGSFSGGATTSKSRTESHPASKYFGKAHITSAALPWFERSLEERPGWARYKADLSIEVVTGNVLFTVPKSTEIDRVAAKEPDLNMYLQKGCGNVIRRALRTVGIDLNDQSKNNALAELGSRHNQLATMDLSSASDSVTRALCYLALPTKWYELLDDLRSPVTSIDGKPHENAMFSSMGNGFTFELESLLFYSIAKATAYTSGVKGVISVYGDDIICPVALYDDLEWVLSYCGFSVNPEKSFKDGPFRESCGGHFLNGADVSPFYLRAPITQLTDLIRLGNQIRQWSDCGTSVMDTGLETLWTMIRDEVPPKFWGGRDLGSITQLVTPGLARQRLVPVKSKPVETGNGGLILWLNSSNGRQAPISPLDIPEGEFQPEGWEHGVLVDIIETSIRRNETGKYRSRPVKHYGNFVPLRSLFLNEL